MTIVAARMKVEIGADTRGAEDGMAKVHKGLGMLGATGQFALGTVLGNAITSAGRQLIGLGSEALGAYADFERLGSSLQQMAAKELLNSGAARSMSEALGKTSGTAAELQGWIQKLAIQSPFTQQGVADAFRMSMAYGFTTAQSKRLTQAMIDFAAGSGASEATMSRIALALGQIQAKGKLAGGEVLQLTEAGLSVNQILADAFGKSTAEVMALREKGLIPADQAIEAIVTSLERDFGGAAARQSGTIAGLVSSLDDLKSVGLQEAFGPVFKEFQPDLDRFVQSMQDPKTLASIRQMGQDFATMAREVVNRGGEIVDKIKEFGPTFKSMVDGGSKAIEWFANLETGTQGAIAAFALLAINARTVGTTITGVSLVVQGLPAMFAGAATALRAFNAGLSLTKSLQEGFGTLPVTLGAIGLAVGAVVAAWVMWNEQIVKTNREGSQAAGGAMGQFLDDARKSGAGAAQITEQFISAYGRMDSEINEAGFAGIFIDRNKLAKESLAALSNQLVSTGVGYDEYTARMADAFKATGAISQQQMRNLRLNRDSAAMTQYLTNRMGVLTREQYVAATMTKLYGDSVDATAQSQKAYAERMQQTAQASSQVTASFLNQSSAAQISAEQLTGLQGAWAGLQQAQQTFNQGFGGQVVAKLEQAGLKGADFEAALGAIDGQLGTNFLAQKNATDALDETIKKYKETKNIEEFDKALGNNKTQWEKLDEGIQTAKKSWLEFVGSIAEANGMSISILVNLITHGNSQGIAGSGSGSGGTVEARASGGPVLSGRQYLVGEQGPELFIPSGSGTIASASMTQQMLAALVGIARRLERGGGGGGNSVPVIQITESFNPRRTARNVGSELGKLQRR